MKIRVLAIFFLLIGYAANAQSIIQSREEKLSIAFEDFYRSDDGRFNANVRLDISDLIKLGLIKVRY